MQSWFNVIMEIFIISLTQKNKDSLAFWLLQFAMFRLKNIQEYIVSFLSFLSLLSLVLYTHTHLVASYIKFFSLFIHLQLALFSFRICVNQQKSSTDLHINLSFSFFFWVQMIIRLPYTVFVNLWCNPLLNPTYPQCSFAVM